MNSFYTSTRPAKGDAIHFQGNPSPVVTAEERGTGCAATRSSKLQFSTAISHPATSQQSLEKTNRSTALVLRSCDEEATLTPYPWSANHAGLKRGKYGIDTVLQHVRESQRLYNELQDRRMERERKLIQRNLKKSLDDQREFNNMLHVAEYQQELVHMYGPTVRDIILDVFFDDNSDPVVNLLKDEQLALQSDRRGRASQKSVCSERELIDAWNEARTAQLRLRGDDGMASKVSLPSTLDTSDEDAAAAALSKKREALNRALDYCRNSKKCAY